MRAVLDIFWNLPFTFRLINFTQKICRRKFLILTICCLTVLRGTFFIFHYRKTVICLEKTEHLHGARGASPETSATTGECHYPGMRRCGDSKYSERRIDKFYSVSLAQQTRRSEQVRSKMKGIKTGCLKNGFTDGGYGIETGMFHIQNTSVLQFNHQSGFCLIIWCASYAFN